MEPLKLGLIGLGTMGRSHLEKEHNLADVRFVGVADVSPDAVRAASEEFAVRGFRGHRELIDCGECEAILIATPHPFHARIALDAARAGLHILCEKPIAVSVSEADQMAAAARENGVLLGVMFQQRTEPVYRRARELLATGVIGRIYRTTMVASAWYRTQAYYDAGDWRGTWNGEGGGVVMNQAPHSLDLFIWLGGTPTRVTAHVQTRGHGIEVEDTVAAHLEYGGDATGYLYTTTSEWPGENRFEFVGDRGKLLIQDGVLRLYRLARSLNEEISLGARWGKPTGAWEDVPIESETTGHAIVVQRFARAIRQGEPLIATAEDGIRQLELANALLLSGYERRSVDLPLDRTSYDLFLRQMRDQR